MMGLLILTLTGIGIVVLIVGAPEGLENTVTIPLGITLVIIGLAAATYSESNNNIKYHERAIEDIKDQRQKRIEHLKEKAND